LYPEDYKYDPEPGLTVRHYEVVEQSFSSELILLAVYPKKGKS